jgi:hypothetical protein
MKDFDKPILIGIVFDVSESRNNDGVLNINVVKDILIKSVLESDSNINVYVSHPDWKQLSRDLGESTYYIASYKEPLKFFVDVAFKNAVTMVGEFPEECEKHIFLITDRFQAARNYHYKKGFLMNSIHNFETQIHTFGMGDFYDRENLKSLVEEYDSKFDHLEDSVFLSQKISEILGK